MLHFILCRALPPFQGLCRSCNFTERKELTLLFETSCTNAWQNSVLGASCKKKKDTEKEQPNIGSTWMLNHGQNSFWLQAIALNICTQYFEHQLQNLVQLVGLIFVPKSLCRDQKKPPTHKTVTLGEMGWRYDDSAYFFIKAKCLLLCSYSSLPCSQRAVKGAVVKASSNRGKSLLHWAQKWNSKSLLLPLPAEQSTC